MATAACGTYRTLADPDLQRVVAEVGQDGAVVMVVKVLVKLDIS
jgi:hypothetical protein